MRLATLGTISQSNFTNFKFLDGGSSHLEKSKDHNISAMD